MAESAGEKSNDWWKNKIQNLEGKIINWVVKNDPLSDPTSSGNAVPQLPGITRILPQTRKLLLKNHELLNFLGKEWQEWQEVVAEENSD